MSAVTPAQVRALKEFLDRTGGPPAGVHPVYYEAVFAAAMREAKRQTRGGEANGKATK